MRYQVLVPGAVRIHKYCSKYGRVYGVHVYLCNIQYTVYSTVVCICVRRNSHESNGTCTSTVVFIGGVTESTHS